MKDNTKKTTKDFSLWSIKEFKNLPPRDWDENIGEFDSLVILPTEDIHDSGYRMMDFVAIDKKRGPLCRLSGRSDVIHIGGIGGYGKRMAHFLLDKPDESPIPWSIDCLPVSGLLRIFCGRPLTVGDALSSFELFA